MKFKLMLLGLAVCCLGGCKTQKSSVAHDLPLQNTQWNLVAINGESISEKGVQPYIIFREDGSYSGNSGCNTFFGKYFSKKQKLELEYSGATKRLCQDMTNEKAFFKALKMNIKTFSITDSTLRLFAGDEEVMIFKGTDPVVEE